MRLSHARVARRAFVIAEAAAVVVIVAALAAVLCISTGDARRRSRLAGSIANLQHYAAGTSAYGADSSDRVWTFSWGPNDFPSQWPDLNNHAGNQLQAAADQAVDILRRRAGRTDIQQITGWICHLYYSALVLSDYLEEPLPPKAAVSPEDLSRLAWQRDPLGFFELPNRPGYPGTYDYLKRWPYSSSYEIGPAFFSQDAATAAGQTVSQYPSDGLYYVGTLPLGGRRLAQVAFPSQKAMLYEQHQRFFGSRVAFFAYPEARVPILFADGSVSVRATNDSNLGFMPNSPTNANPLRFNYLPDLAWEPPTLNGASGEIVTGHYRWTRSGLRGRDFGGPEVPWVP